MADATYRLSFSIPTDSYHKPNSNPDYSKSIKRVEEEWRTALKMKKKVTGKSAGAGMLLPENSQLLRYKIPDSTHRDVYNLLFSDTKIVSQ